MLIYPSLIAGDILNLQKEITILEHYCDGFHIDIMDFHFVPNLTWGPIFVNAIRLSTMRELWIHLMVDNPAAYFPLLKLNKGDIITIHREHPHHLALLEEIQSHEFLASLAYNPETPLDPAQFYETIDHVLLMTVRPGFSGQTFMKEVLEKLEQLVSLREEHKFNFTIALDGGIRKEQLPELARSGVNAVAMGFGLFEEQS